MFLPYRDPNTWTRRSTSLILCKETSLRRSTLDLLSSLIESVSRLPSNKGPYPYRIRIRGQTFPRTTWIPRLTTGPSSYHFPLHPTRLILPVRLRSSTSRTPVSFLQPSLVVCVPLPLGILSSNLSRSYLLHSTPNLTIEHSPPSSPLHPYLSDSPKIYTILPSEPVPLPLLPK